MSVRMFAPTRLRFIDEPNENDGGSGDVDQEAAAGQSTAGDTESDPVKTPGTPEYKVAAAEKVAKDLERKLADARKAADRAKELEAELAKLQGKEAEYTAAQEAAKVKSEALAAANDRILRAEVRAAAAGKLTDPSDALRLLDLSSFEVGDDGEVDGAALAAAIDNLLQTKPYLAAQGERRFQGGADGGTRKESAKSLDDQIADATAKGDTRLALHLTNQKLAALAADKG